MAGTFLKAAGSILKGLVAPASSIEGPEIRRRVVLLNTLLLIYLIATILMLAIILQDYLSGGQYFTFSTIVVVSSCVVLFAIFWGLAKTRHYALAGVCFCLTINVGCLIAAIMRGSSQASSGITPFFLIPVLIAMFVLPLRAVIYIGLTSLTGALLTTWVTAQSLASSTSLWHLMITLALVLAGSLLRSYDTKQMEGERLQLFHAARMSTLGEMAGGIAHEVNNPVAVIQLRASQALRILRQKPEEMGRLEEFLEAIKRTASHIEKVVRGLRAFSRSGLSDPLESAYIKGVIDDTLAMCEEQLRYAQIEVRVLPFNDSLQAECRAIQISQILLNLISNSLAAIQEMAERWIHIEVHDRGGRVAISVTDSGPGIAPEIARRVFEPFFTTKRDGHGTGIGLSISHNLAKTNNGSLIIDQDSPRTRFVLELLKST